MKHNHVNCRPVERSPNLLDPSKLPPIAHLHSRPIKKLTHMVQSMTMATVSGHNHDCHKAMAKEMDTLNELAKREYCHFGTHSTFHPANEMTALVNAGKAFASVISEQGGFPKPVVKYGKFTAVLDPVGQFRGVFLYAVYGGKQFPCESYLIHSVASVIADAITAEQVEMLPVMMESPPGLWEPKLAAYCQPCGKAYINQPCKLHSKGASQ